MGQFMTSSRIYNNNDELINALIKSKIILSKDIEKVFRCVDRGFYISNNERNTAYEDSALQSDLIHLSSPSIYASVLECLKLQPGHKFLNIGSGIGYLSTVAGLLLDVNGVNHGIEINQLVIDLALQKMDEFKLNAAAIDHYNFCEPVFIHGNVCELLSLGYYDRVYCGASVPPEESEFLKSLINIGGILVMPLDGYLLKVTRQNETTWKTEKVFEVAFTDLVVPPKNSFKIVKFPSVKPLSLQELCRSAIRSLLRGNLKNQFPDLSIRTKCHLETEEYKDVDSDSHSTQSCPSFYYNSVTNDGLVRNLVHFVDTFSVLEGALSDVVSDSDFGTDDDSEIEDDNNEHRSEEDGNEQRTEDDDNELKTEEGDNKLTTEENDNELKTEEDNERRTEENKLEQSLPHCTFTHKTSDETIKRKSPEAKVSEQNKTSTERENPKRMRMNSSSQKSETSTSSPNHTDSWKTVSSNSSRSSLHHSNSESLSSSMDDDVENYMNEHSLGRLHSSLFYGESREEESEVSTDSEDARDSVTYRFINERKENKLSIHLKGKIDSLPIPVPLKNFLNFYRFD